MAVRVQVVIAWPRRHRCRELLLEDGATAQEAALRSGLMEEGVAGLAVFGVAVAPGHRLREGDRVELLGPLRADPKEARRRRAAQRPLR